MLPQESWRGWCTGQTSQSCVPSHTVTRLQGFAVQNGSAGKWGAELKALHLNGLSGWLPVPLPVGAVTAVSAETAGSCVL